MEFNSSSFFCNKKEGPKTSLRFSEPEDPWPITLSIYNKDVNTPEIHIYIASESDLIRFKNSVIEAYDKYRRLRGYDR